MIFQLDGPHWQFSLKLYARDGVAPACLYLQDAHGVDVNILLIALHAGLEGGRNVGATQIAALDKAVQEQRETLVLPLRTMRGFLKPLPFGAGSELLRTAIKKAELAAEQFEQLCLARQASTFPVGGENGPEEICWRVLEHFDPGRVFSDPMTGDSIAAIVKAAGKR